MASIYANGAKGYHKFTLTVSENSTDKESNSSEVSFSFVIAPIISGYKWSSWGSAISYTVTIDGTDYTGAIPSYGGNSTVTLKSGTQTVAHNADGTKALNFSFSVTDAAGVSYTCGNASAEGSMDLTRIFRTPPTVSAAVEDCNPATVALTGDKGVLVRYFSNAAFTFEATAYDGATIAGRTTTCGGKDLYGESGVFEKVESGSFNFRARDSYGNVTNAPLELPLIPYIPLTCNLANTKPDAEGNMQVSVSGNCFMGSFGAMENRLTVYYRYRESGGSFGDWVQMAAVQSESGYTATGDVTGLDYQKTFVFQAKAEDLLDRAETPEYTAKAIPVFDWGEDDFNINGTLKLNGAAMTDFVVEEGTDGDWSYRKWASGVAECWFRGQVTLTYGMQVNGFHFGYGTVDFPFAFAEKPVVTYSVEATDSYLFCGKSVTYGGNFNFYVGSVADLSGVSKVTVSAHAIGKIK